MKGMRKRALAVAIVLSLTGSLALIQPAHAVTLYDPKNNVASTPPMGWNSYNIFGGTFFPEQADCTLPSCIPLNEARIKATAEALISSGLRDKGYVYINLDDRWQDPRQPRAANGELRWDERRFPSGIPALASWLHDRGLKLGLYVLPNDRACGGEEGPTNKPNWPAGLPETGSMGHEYVDAQTFANWGVDYLKFDWCGVNEVNRGGQAGSVFKLWNQAIQASGRNMLVAASTWGWENEGTWGPSYAHTWRIDSDVYPQWSDILRTLDKGSTVALRSASGPTKGWNDFDTMQVGNPGLSEAENRTQFIMWAMENSPLILGNDLRNTTADLLKLIGNEEIIAVNQDSLGEQAWVASTSGSVQVWARSLLDGSKAVAVLNRGATSATTPIVFSDIFLGSEAGNVRSLLDHVNLGAYANRYTVTVAPHDTLVFKVSPVDSQSIEAESAQFAGGARAQTCPTCSGGKNAGYIGNGSGTASLTVSVPTAGTYGISVFFATADPRSLTLAANGQSVVAANLNSGSWTTLATYTVFLPLVAGSNQIVLSNPTGWAPDIDRLVIARSS
ncbi:MAG: hypothetical protein LBI33_07180 [Propionibacteriaceae bacterium]|jgi:alpha-galactosidase|nr:hypothetical protein [Propionibacteriaceae bacterium]